MSAIQLSNKLNIPQVGFGVYKITKDDCCRCVIDAIYAGYRLFDTAEAYHNEEYVGEAIRYCIQEGIIKREDVFVITKLSPHNKIGYEETKKAIKGSLERLGIDYIDLYLIHWPNVTPDDRWKRLNAESWLAMEEFFYEGKIKSLGVSNFLQHHIEELLKTAKIKPVVNQLNLNPTWPQKDAVDYCRSKNIQCVAWAPIIKVEKWNTKLLETLSKKYQKSVAQISLRWSVQKGFIPLAKTVHKERMIENLSIFDFEISEDDMDKLDGLLCHPDEHAATPDSIYTIWKQMLLIKNLTNNKKTIKKEVLKLFNLFPFYKIMYSYDNAKKLRKEKHYLLGIIPYLKKVYVNDNRARVYLFKIRIGTCYKIENPWKEINTLPVYED